MIIEQDERLRDGLVAIGRVARPQGRFGEVVVDSLTDFPERFQALGRVVLAGTRGSETLSVRVESARLHKGRPVVKLEGVSSIDDAEKLRGRELRIPESDVTPLPEGSFYHFELIGLAVSDHEGNLLGKVEDVMVTGGTDLLVVRGSDGKEVLVPLCREICGEIDVARGSIRVDAPDGLVGLNED